MEGNLHCPDKGSLPFECVHLDHYGPLECPGHRQRYVLEVIDAFTKFVKLYPVTSTRSDELIKHLTTYFNTYSAPKRVVNDRGSAFTSQKFKEFLAQYVGRHILVATPHANGQIERTNRSLTSILAKLTKAQSRWKDVLAEAEFALNNTVNRSTGDTPARLLFGTNQVGRTNVELRVLQ